MELNQWLLLVWLFVLGTIIGSFLNVVVYRLPRGQNLISPASRCPKCDRPIRWFDNVPILGWLWLRGRCRDCSATISPRYPLVEAAVGLLFLTFGWTDLVWPGEPVADVAHIPAEYFAIYGFHLMLLCPLFAATLIDSDGQRVPRQLITWPCATGIFLAMAYPGVEVLWFNFSHHSQSGGMSVWPLVNSVLGLVAAIFLRLNALQIVGYQKSRSNGL
jgi:leader peptidase (prepilin peptidase)/N-methyltransferase